MKKLKPSKSSSEKGLPNKPEQKSEVAQILEWQSRIFDTTLSSITDFAYTFDKEGRFVYSNQALLDLLGITLEEIIGKNFFDLNYPNDLAARLQSQIQQVFDTGETIKDETSFTTPTGVSGYYEYIFNPVAADGSVELVVGLTRDVTERNATEESIRFQAHLLDTVEQSVIATDLEGKVIFWNQFAAKLYGWTAKEAMGRNIMELTTPDIMTEQANEIMSVLCQGKSWSGEFQVKKRNDTTFPAQFFNSPIQDSQGKLVGIVGVSVDITERKQVEEKLSRSEAELRLITDSIPSLISYVDKTERYRFVNAVYEEWFKQPREQIIGHTMENVLGAAYPAVKENARRALAGETVIFENKLDYPQEQRCVLAQYIPDTDASGEVQGFYAHVTDIGESKRAEEALRESETRFRAMFEQANIGIVQIDFDGRFLAVNPGYCKIIGYTEAELQKLTVGDITHPDDYELEDAENRRLIAGKISGYSIEKRCFHKNGSTVWTMMTATLVRRESGEPFYTLSIVEDITTRKQAEEALRESEDRLRLLVEGASDYAIFTVTPDNIVDSWNTGAEKVFGYKEREIIGKSGAILFTREDREHGVPEQEIKTAAAKGRAEDERWHIRQDGTRFYASGVMTLLKDGTNGFVKIARDMTDKMISEKNLRDKEILQKLVGAQEEERKRIARDLHDQLGQQLTALRLKLENIRKLCEDNNELCAKIDETQVIAKHIDNDVDFLAWELRPAALDDLGLVAALENYAREWSRHSGITAEFYTSGLKKARLTPEAETNLYRITQEALNNVHKHAAAKSANVMLERRGSLIILIVEDDGKGFDPKEKLNRSKGLGLIGMGERATLIGGKIQIESTPKNGTTVFVRIPI